MPFIFFILNSRYCSYKGSIKLYFKGIYIVDAAAKEVSYAGPKVIVINKQQTAS